MAFHLLVYYIKRKIYLRLNRLRRTTKVVYIIINVKSYIKFKIKKYYELSSITMAYSPNIQSKVNLKGWLLT